MCVFRLLLSFHYAIEKKLNYEVNNNMRDHSRPAIESNKMKFDMS